MTDPKIIKKRNQRTAQSKLREKVIDLHFKGVSNSLISKAVGLTPDTVSRTLKRFKETFKELDNVEDFEASREKLYSATELKVLKALNDDSKLSDASYASIAASLKTIHHARRLESGLSTSNSEVNGKFLSVQLPEIDDDPSRS